MPKAPPVSGKSRPVQHGETITADCVQIHTHLEKNLRQNLFALIYGSMQCRVALVVPLIDSDVRLAD